MNRIVVVCEGPDDFLACTILADRVLVKEHGWLQEAADLDDFRRYTGIDRGISFLRWRDVKNRHGWVRLDGFRGRGVSGETLTARKALLLVARAHCEQEPVLGAVLFRDADKAGAQRRSALVEARNNLRQAGAGVDPWCSHIAIGVADPKSEAWVLLGFRAEDREEEDTLFHLRQELGFDPTVESHRLTASDRASGSKKSAKKVCDALCPAPGRRQGCLQEAPLSQLLGRGGPSGLADFLDDIHRELSPAFGGGSARGS